MPHVALVPLTGFRVREPEMLALGMSLPGLRDRAAAVGALPALGPLTLAGMMPPGLGVVAWWSPSVRTILARMGRGGNGVSVRGEKIGSWVVVGAEHHQKERPDERRAYESGAAGSRSDCEVEGGES